MLATHGPREGWDDVREDVPIDAGFCAKVKAVRSTFEIVLDDGRKYVTSGSAAK
ncbi:MAG TPA: hypothetical protein VGS00_09205 [Thermoanaerobaculia bacterium]|nr:hypothetical protein [Thermoanaerobaculia bacterium]